METTTKQIINELHDEAMAEIMPLACELENQGVDQVKILNYVEKILNAKRAQFYDQISGPQSLKHGLEKALEKIGINFGIEEKKADSKAESVFYELMQKHGIPFDFQVKIGPYRVDYLIAGVLIFEGDGPQHLLTTEYDKRRDDYLRKMGYVVFRLSWEIVAILQDRVIEEIKKQVSELGVSL